MSSHPYISNETFSAAIVDAKNYNQWVVDFYKSYIRGDVLEIGVGHGSFIDFMPQEVSSYTGFDIDNLLIEAAQKRNPQAQYFCGDLACSDFSKTLKAKRFDTAICINVLEHIDNHQAALENLLNILKPHGRIILFVPAFMSLYQDMDRLAGHCRRYTKSSMQALCDTTNANLISCKYFNAIGGIGWWLNKFKTHTNLNDTSINAQIRFFDKYILPISKCVQPLSGEFFGQSLYCVIGRKS